MVQLDALVPTCVKKERHLVSDVQPDIVFQYVQDQASVHNHTILQCHHHSAVQSMSKASRRVVREALS
jgi:hypothetical protein